MKKIIMNSEIWLYRRICRRLRTTDKRKILRRITRITLKSIKARGKPHFEWLYYV